MQISNIYNRFATSYIVVRKPFVFLTLMIYYMLLASLSLYRASVRWVNVNQVAPQAKRPHTATVALAPSPRCCLFFFF